MHVNKFECYYCGEIGLLLMRFFFSYVIQWKFASFSMGRPDYLQDTDVVYTRFQVNQTCYPLLVIPLKKKFETLTYGKRKW